VDVNLLFEPNYARESGLPGICAFGTKRGAAAELTCVQLSGTEERYEAQTSETP